MSGIRKMLLKNIDQEIEFILIKQKQYDLDSFVRGYHENDAFILTVYFCPGFSENTTRKFTNMLHSF